MADLILGLLLAASFGVAVYALWLMRAKSRSVAEANRVFQMEITERIQIENKLRESEERLRIVLSAATGVSVIATDPEGLITYFSKGSEKLLGYSAEEMIGKVSPAVFHDGEEVRMRGEELTREFGQKIEGFAVFVTKPGLEGSERREWNYVCKDGTYKKVELTVTVLRDSSGSVTGFLGTAIDITERKQLEKSLREGADLLAERNRQLQVVTAQAQAHARAKAEFLSNMSHEIRTPLNAIIGMSELLLEVSEDQRDREFVETIRTSGDALLSIINDILDFSKIEAGRLELEHVPMDLRDCVEFSLDLVSAQAANKKLDLLYWIDPAVPASILGDVTRLRQVLVNLVMNGVKFTEKGEIFVRIDKTRSDDGRDMLHVSIRDTGVGIPSELQDRLFLAFSQVDASTSRRYGGTGLGLAICHRLVTTMKGRIWVESAEDKGADFQFEIPLESAPMMSPKLYQQGTVSELSGLRVLIVDDNETNRWILQTQTASWAMQSRVTGKPYEALRWIERGDPFDLAILDAEMPEMDGYELAEKMRAHQTSQELPILILTSKGDLRRDFDKFGIKANLTKPVKISALFKIISELLFGKRTSQRLSSKTEGLLASECPLKILVAEDNPVNQRVTMLLLERLGYRSEMVANGMEVIMAVQRGKFDVILLDVQMPEMDGFQAAQEICHLYPYGERPYMIALTADAEENDRGKCLAAGMDDYLSKPVRSNGLAGVLRTAFAKIPKNNQQA